MVDERGYYEEESEDYQPRVADKFFIEAQNDIRALYEADREVVYYIRQMQVKFEKKYFHWVTNNALVVLLRIKYLKDFRIPTEKGTSTRYFIHRSNRYPKRNIAEIEQVIQEYSQDHITRSCGHHAEDLFCNALALRGFMPIGVKVKEYKGKEWTETGHDLDFIFSRDGVDYGCEIKNTLGYIDGEELKIKLKMCSFFGVKPLFILRYSPKTYNWAIYHEGGYAMIYETQIYDVSQLTLVDKIKKVTGLPVICSAKIPDGIIDRFENWHMRGSK